MAAKDGLPRRKFRDDVELSVVGFGGIVVVGMEQRRADAAVARAVEEGVNYFDVAPTYGKGEAQEKLGPALEPFREDVFLACKTAARDARTAREQLKESLRTLRTERFDLYQFHGITSEEDVDRILAPGGAAEAFRRAKEEGLVRYIGLSAHCEAPAIRLLSAMELDSVLFPVNFVCWGQGGFGEAILDAAREKGVSRLALKSLAYTRRAKGERREFPKCWYVPVNDEALRGEALRFTLSQDVTAAVSPSEETLLRSMIEHAKRFEPMNEKEQQAFLARAEGVEPIFRS